MKRRICVQGPRKDGCHWGLASITFYDMGAAGARLLLMLVNFPYQILYFVIIV